LGNQSAKSRTSRRGEGRGREGKEVRTTMRDLAHRQNPRVKERWANPESEWACIQGKERREEGAMAGTTHQCHGLVEATVEAGFIKGEIDIISS